MPGKQGYCKRMFLVYTVQQVALACRTVSEHFTYFPCKYVKSHFSGRVNGLSKAYYFYTEVERVTKHIVTREIRDNKIRELARVYLSRAVTTRWMSDALRRHARHVVDAAQILHRRAILRSLLRTY